MQIRPISNTFLRTSILAVSASVNRSSQLRRKSYDEASRDVRVSVWWDFENCNLPAGANPFKVAQVVTSAIRTSGIKGPIMITAFGDLLQLSRTNQEALCSTGINLTHVPNGGKNSADRSLLVDLMFWVSQNPPPAHLFLISGDRDFANTLYRLRMKNYNILLASNGSEPAVLSSSASIMWDWFSLVKGENVVGKIFNRPPDGPYGSSYGDSNGPLRDPFATREQSAAVKTEESPDNSPDSDSKIHNSPEDVVVKQICKILSSNPKGISIAGLRTELSKSKVVVDKKYYGYKKFSRFLASMSGLIKLYCGADGEIMVHGIGWKAPESFKSCTGLSVGSDWRTQDKGMKAPGHDLV